MIGAHAAVAAAALVAPQPHPAPTPLQARYEHAYRAVARKLGPRTPGRDIVRHGLPDGHPAPPRVIRRSLAVFQRMLHPAPRTVSVTSSAVATPVIAAASTTAPPVPVSSGAGGLPACASESGTNYSTGPANTNPSSGATGRYQIIPSTAAGYGCNLSTPAGQDACAQTIYRNQGAGAWVGCGG